MTECRWGRDLFINPNAMPCPVEGIHHVVLHDPDDPDLVSEILPICAEHVAAIAADSIRTPPEQVARYDQWRSR